MTTTTGAMMILLLVVVLPFVGEAFPITPTEFCISSSTRIRNNNNKRFWDKASNQHQTLYYSTNHLLKKKSQRSNSRKLLYPCCIFLSAASSSSSSSSSSVTVVEASPTSVGTVESSSPTFNPNQITNPRLEALRALIARRRGGGRGGNVFPVEHLEASWGYQSLQYRDRSFARLLVSTVERRQGQIDKLLQKLQTQPPQQEPPPPPQEPPRTSTSSSNNNDNNKKKKKKKKQRAKEQQFLVNQYVQNVLRLGVAQLLFLKTPPHAACKETVDLLRLSSSSLLYKQQQQQQSSSSSLQQSQPKDFLIPPNVVISKGKIKYVNAILRRIALDGNDMLEKYTCITDNVAPWLLQEWKQTWGIQRTNEIINQALSISPRCLTVRQQPGASTTERNKVIQQVAQQFRTLVPSCHVKIMSQGSIQLIQPPQGPISKWPGYNNGTWYIQDPSATIPARALYETFKRRKRRNDDDEYCNNPAVTNLHVVDICAAPGGKTSQLCCYGFHVTAIDISTKRCIRLRENLQRLNLTCNVVVADATQWLPTTTTTTNNNTTTTITNNNDKNQNNNNNNNNDIENCATRTTRRTRRIDGILLDVPCTATGTGSRRPDVLRRDSNYTNLLQIQYDLICHAVDHLLCVDGVLVYSTCSLLRQEGEEQILRLLQSRPKQKNNKNNTKNKNNNAPPSCPPPNNKVVANNYNNDKNKKNMVNHDKDKMTMTTTQLEILPFQLKEIENIPGCQIDNDHGWLRVFPNTDNQMDGFFVARMRKLA